MQGKMQRTLLILHNEKTVELTDTLRSLKRATQIAV